MEMKYIEGETLEASWDSMSQDTRFGITHELHDIPMTMRVFAPSPNLPKPSPINLHKLLRTQIRSYHYHIQPSPPKSDNHYELNIAYMQDYMRVNVGVEEDSKCYRS